MSAIGHDDYPRLWGDRRKVALGVSTSAQRCGETTGGRRVSSQDSVLAVDGLVKQFRREGGEVVSAVDDVSLTVGPGECLVLLGPSGCGKTTLLRCIAGLERPDHGTVFTPSESYFSRDRQIDRPPERRRASMMFQSYALWPHMTISQNVAFPLIAKKVVRREIPDRVEEILNLVGIETLKDQYPNQLSGGQQQRAALARALVSNDPLILFDEPLSNVDAKVRVELRRELIDMQKKLRFAAIYVTHDQAEAMELAHRIAVLEKGKIVQVGSPKEIYERPNTIGIARFIGAANFLSGIVTTVRSSEIDVDCLGRTIKAVAAAPGMLAKGDRVDLVFRPERCELDDSGSMLANQVEGTLVDVQYMGARTQCTIRVADDLFRVDTTDPPPVAIGGGIWLNVRPEHMIGLKSETLTAPLNGNSSAIQLTEQDIALETSATNEKLSSGE